MKLNHVSDEEIKKLYWEDGKSGKEIASIFGVAPSAICYRMKKAGIKTRHAREYPPTEKQKEAWRINGLNLCERYAASPERMAQIGTANKGKRKRTDYEFGGHEKLRSDGYVRVYTPEHPHSSADGYVMKHILIVEREIGRYLNEDEVVHHINHIRNDNRIENLRLMTKHDHMSMHMKERHEKRRMKNYGT